MSSTADCLVLIPIYLLVQSFNAESLAKSSLGMHTSVGKSMQTALHKRFENVRRESSCDLVTCAVEEHAGLNHMP